MSRLPRILPLTAIAVGGVLGIKMLADIQAVPQALAGARAWAEEAVSSAKPAKPAGKAPARASDAKAGETPSNSMPPSVAAPTSVAVCAPSAAELAKSAGLSPAELQVLQSLGTRRGQLDQREQAMDTQMALLAAAEAKLDAKLKSLNGLKGEMAALLGSVDKKQEEETLRLVSVYEKMKPRDAANVMAQLDDKVRIPVAAKMKDRALAAVLSAMPASEAKKITELLAQRYAAVQAAVQAMNAPPKPVAEPVQTAEAEKPAAPKPRARPKARRKAVAAAKPTAPSTPVTPASEPVGTPKA